MACVVCVGYDPSMLRALHSLSVSLSLFVVCAVGCPGGDNNDDPADVDPVDAVIADCAALDDDVRAEFGVERPAGWRPLVHCKKAPPDVDTVFGGVPKLTIRMSADEYAAMQADLDDLTGGGGGGGGDDPFLVACAGLAVDDVCAIDLGGGPEDGVCVDFDGLLACIPNSFRAPQEWVDACAGADEGSACTTSDHDGICFFDGLSFACFPDDGGGGPGPGPSVGQPCAGASDGDVCDNGGGSGVCAPTSQAGFLVCVVDGFDDADLSFVPLDAAAPFWDREPAYFHADLTFAGETFTSVGIRYKGNNGLASSNGEKKPLRLKLDEWEDEVPAITDQRMFGFQHLSLAPNHTDPSNLHQVLAAAAFRDNGVPAPLAGFVEVELDSGDGPRLLGLYAITEIPDNPLLKRIFESDEGNLYKPDGRGAHFRSFHEESFHKENNDDVAFDDVNAFVDAVNADNADRAPNWSAPLI